MGYSAEMECGCERCYCDDCAQKAADESPCEFCEGKYHFHKTSCRDCEMVVLTDHYKACDGFQCPFMQRFDDNCCEPCLDKFLNANASTLNTVYGAHASRKLQCGHTLCVFHAKYKRCGSISCPECESVAAQEKAEKRRKLKKAQERANIVADLAALRQIGIKSKALNKFVQKIEQRKRQK